MGVRILVGDVREMLATLPDESVHCVVTSPPYWGLRDYGVEGQIGLESSPAEFIATMTAVFREVRRVLRADGTCWMNMGDSYSSIGHKKSHSGFGTTGLAGGKAQENTPLRRENNASSLGLKHKDLVGMPWRLAFALQADGWWLRQDVIWHKPNPMPESVRDRCTKAHEYIFLLTKSERYWYDADAISEPVTDTTIERVSQAGLADQAGSDRVPGKTNGPMKAVIKKSGNKARKPATARGCPNEGVAASVPWEGTMRNKRSVWTITTKGFSEAHFATFPPELPEICIKAGCPPGGTVLDPFFGAGTTGLVADRLGRDCIGIELNPAYADMARRRILGDAPLLVTVSCPS